MGRVDRLHRRSARCRLRSDSSRVRRAGPGHGGRGRSGTDSQALRTQGYHSAIRTDISSDQDLRTARRCRRSRVVSFTARPSTRTPVPWCSLADHAGSWPPKPRFESSWDYQIHGDDRRGCTPPVAGVVYGRSQRAGFEALPVGLDCPTTIAWGSPLATVARRLASRGGRVPSRRTRGGTPPDCRRSKHTPPSPKGWFLERGLRLADTVNPAPDPPSQPGIGCRRAPTVSPSSPV